MNLGYTPDQAIYCMARANDIDFVTARALGECYKKAVADLGPDLMGYSPVDLIADNFPSLPLGTVRRILQAAELL